MVTINNSADHQVTQYNTITGGASNVLNNVAPSATSGVPLISQGSSAQPIYGTALVAGGGTGAVTLTGVLTGNGTSAVTASTVTQHGVIIGAASNAVGSTSVGSTGQVLQANTSADPTYSTATYPSVGTSTGSLLRADGTNWSATTTTYPNTNAINTLLYASSANVMSALATANNGLLITGTTGIPSILADGTTGQILTATTGSPPSWVDPATSGTVTSVSGTANQVSVANGTTTPVISLVGPYTPATYTAHGVLIGEGTSSIAALAAGSSGQVLQSGGASADPAYSTATYPATATGTGTILRADGTNWSATTTTYPNTNAINTLLYASSANVMSALATANTAVLATNGSGVPSITATPTVTSITFGSGSALSIYATNTWTPNLQINSSNTGITYSVQYGTYTQIGSLVSFAIYIQLSSKGASSGVVTISNMPVATGGYGIVQSAPINAYTGLTLAGYSQASLILQASNTIAVLSVSSAIGTGGFSNITNTMITNSFLFYASGVYMTT